MKIRLITIVTSIALAICAVFSPVILAASAEDIAEGKKLAFDRKLGNCLACHAIAGGTLPGNIGPVLIAMKARFPDKSTLRAQIYDATANNPKTAMPPFGKHGILTDKQVDLVTEFIHTL
ncbi:MAG: sulfur oxidation c-type cytochrome SoxX [Gammaproteobacteria bacterium]|nr:sulfur oxidation c-type cytochrome SoxX [Gammaproteobacteria bacterium]